MLPKRKHLAVLNLQCPGQQPARVVQAQVLFNQRWVALNVHINAWPLELAHLQLFVYLAKILGMSLGVMGEKSCRHCYPSDNYGCRSMVYTHIQEIDMYFLDIHMHIRLVICLCILLKTNPENGCAVSKTHTVHQIESMAPRRYVCVHGTSSLRRTSHYTFQLICLEFKGIDLIQKETYACEVVCC